MKRLSKLIECIVNKSRIKVALCALGIFVILMIWVFWQDKNIVDAVFDILISQDTFSFLSAFLITVILAKFFSRFDKYTEESLKTEENHHKIIDQYKSHLVGKTSYDNSVINKEGEYLLLKSVPTRSKEELDKTKKSLNKTEQKQLKKFLLKREKILARLERIKNPTKIIKRYMNGELYLSSLNVFANISADTEIKFNDSAEKQSLPSFVINNVNEILQAHKNSIKSNSTTIRLDDFNYSNNVLELDTSRTTYYNMLVTNRCMDYKFANGLSIREVYEYDDKICPVEYSKLGNQIGINGLIVTSDNYILVEKRGHNKIIWKNKFAQSISLALKLKDLKLDRRDVLANDTETAQEKLKYIITKTVKGNFGLTGHDYETFTIKENFLGLARDLLEGGKPNLYFYVKTKQTAKELKEQLEKNITLKNKDEEYIIKESKLESDYYLIPFEQVDIDLNYKMSLFRKNILKVHRKVYPRCNRIVEFWEKIKEVKDNLFDPIFVRECGEALLVTLAYMELRWDWLKKGENINEK